MEHPFLKLPPLPMWEVKKPRPAAHAIAWKKIKKATFVCGATGAGGAWIALKTLKPKTPHTFLVAAGSGFIADGFPCALGFAAAGWD